MTNEEQKNEKIQLNEIITINRGVSANVRAKLEECTFVGIDFGTSTTTVTRLVYDSDIQQVMSAPMMIAQADASGVEIESHLVPTVVATTGGGRLIFGEGAKACLLNEETSAEGYNVWSEFKMRLGENACYPHSHLLASKTPDPNVVIEQPKDAARHFFKFLKSAIERTVEKENLPKIVRYAVTVPASFAPNQRVELCEAIRDAGIELDPAALLDEPNSAFMGAVAYYAEGGETAEFFNGGEDARVLVFDFGAGTCDISLLKVSRDGRMQNLAISHFTALGGRNLDDKIARDVLYLKLVKGRKSEDLPVLTIRENIISKLHPVAEQLKVATCENFESLMGDKAFLAARDGRCPPVEARFQLKTSQFGVLEDLSLQLRPEEFADIMECFTEDSRKAFENGHKSVFDPIDEVLRKAQYSADELDFILMVGGSSLNPFVKDRIEEHFPGVRLLADADPRTLVSRGAAIHSFAVNGFGQSFILPITSEDIYAETRTGKVLVFRAGMPVPIRMREIDAGLYIDDETATNGKFGIPFLASDDARKIGTATFELLDIGRGCEVKLSCGITADKVLECVIEAAGKRFEHRFDMPASSEHLSPDELALTAAKNDLDFTAVVNRGTPSVAQYRKVAELCTKLGKDELAADYYRDLMYAHRTEHLESEIAASYRKADRANEALAWIRRACDYRKSYLNIWYLIWDLERVQGWDSAEVAKWLDYAIVRWPDDDDFKFIKMRQLENTNQEEAAGRLAKRLCETWEQEGVPTLGEYTLERFEVVARKVGRGDLVSDCKRQLKMLHGNKDKAKDGESFTMLSAHALDKDGEVMK